MRCDGDVGTTANNHVVSRRAHDVVATTGQPTSRPARRQGQKTKKAAETGGPLRVWMTSSPVPQGVAGRVVVGPEEDGHFVTTSTKADCYAQLNDGCRCGTTATPDQVAVTSVLLPRHS